MRAVHITHWPASQLGHHQCTSGARSLQVSAQAPSLLLVLSQGPHFWDESTYPDLRKKDPARAGKYDGSFGAYVRIFDKAAAHIQRHPTAITGEASSNTFTAVYSHLR